LLKKLSIRNKLISSIIIGCLIPYLISGVYIKDKTEEWLYNDNIEKTNLLLQQTVTHVDESILKNINNLVTMISIDERIMNIDSNINSYVDYDPNTFKYRFTESENSIMEYFRAIKESHDVITMISVGTEDGGYIEYPKFKPIAPYDPRTRDWYADGIHHTETVISEPYITKVTGDLVISLVKSVNLNGRNIGVVCVTINLDNLMKDINKIRYGKSGYIDILSPNNIFINSPQKEEWLFHSIEESELNVFNPINQYNHKSFEGIIDSVEKVFNVYISPYSGWKYIFVIDKSEVLEQSRVLTGLLLAIFLVTLLIILTLMFFISNHIAKPILAIAAVINKMATFKFDAYKNKNIKVYTNNNDEIGEISRALNVMQDNFIELKSKMKSIDEEIQTINVDGSTLHQLELSKDNPFAGITSSVNILLQKVHSSIEQVNLVNEEVSYKNELLVASEEELTAQLEEINTQNDFIMFLAEHDPLTNLPNRRKFNEKLNQVLADGGIGAVLLLDLDNFKGVNDTLGHLFGDRVLEYISGKLKEMSGQNIFVSRFGGDEFLILYQCQDHTDETLQFIEQLYTVFDDKFLIDQHEIKIEFSIGISLFPKDSQDINQLIINADLAMYNVKNKGKNNHAFFDNKMADHLKHKLDTKIILRDAVTNNGFKLLYQPQVDIHSGEIIGYEALIRLKDYTLSPMEFIAIAEEDGMIITIGRIVTRMAIEQIRQWQQKGYSLKPVAINFSAVQIHDHDYLAYLMNLLETNDVKPELIVIEITENVFLENKDTTIAFLNSLRAHGIKIAIDDFGTGFSSLSYLTFLPLDTIKLDRALCIKFLELENITVMDSLIALAHSLNLKVIAEGIEEYQQVQKLMVGKCDAVQGYYFSKPLEVDEIERKFEMIYEL
jgi:diguanylate cyclase (GGDEF)-like protein